MSEITIAIAGDRHHSKLLNFLKKHSQMLRRHHLGVPKALQGELSDLELSTEAYDRDRLFDDLKDRSILAILYFLDATDNEGQLQELIQRCGDRQIPLAFNPATAESVVSSLHQSQFAHLIFNPVSGQGDPQETLRTIEESLSPYYHLSVSCTTPDIGAAQLAREALEHPPDLLLVSGGDGTVSAVARAAIGSDVPLGVLARGTANAFAKALAIPETIPEACQTIAAEHTRRIDSVRGVGETGDRDSMVLLAGIGLEAGVVERADSDLKDEFGAMGYLLAGFQQADEQNLFHVTLEIDGEKSKPFEATAVTVANAAPPTSVLAQGQGKVDPADGKLDITIAAPRDRLSAVQSAMDLWGSALAEQSPDRDDIIHLSAKRVRIETDPPQKITLDGEMAGTTPIELECLPGSLEVVVPMQPSPSWVKQAMMYLAHRFHTQKVFVVTGIDLVGFALCALVIWGFQQLADPVWDVGMGQSWLWEWLTRAIAQLASPTILAAMAGLVMGTTWRRDVRVARLAVGITAGVIALAFGIQALGESGEIAGLLGATAIYGLAAYRRSRRSRHWGWRYLGMAALVVLAVAFSWLDLGAISLAEAGVGVLTGALWLGSGILSLILTEAYAESD